MNGTSNTSSIRFTLELVRVCFISAEFLLALSVMVVGIYLPSAWIFVGHHIRGQPEVMKSLPVIPIALCGFSINLAWKLITPKSGSNRELYDWPDYWKLKLRRDVTIGLCVGCAAVSLLLWIFGAKFTNLWLGSIATWAISSSLITCGFALFASFTLKEIMED